MTFGNLQATRQRHSPQWLSDAVDVMILAAVLLTLVLAALL
jgi:hypothetical protein